MAKISIITVNYNSSDDTINLITSLDKVTSIDYELIIIDNGSSKQQYDILKQSKQLDKSYIKFLRSDINLGFGGGNMLGVNISSKESNYYFFLNNDIILLNDVVGILHKYMEQNSSAGLIAPQMFDKNKNFSTTFRNFPNVTECYLGKSINRLFSLKKIHNNKIAHKEAIDVEIVSGACMFFRKTVFDSIGGFDDYFFLYCEEEDLSKRCSNFGYSVALVPEAKLIHLSGGSTKRNFLIEREFVIAYFYLVSKHYDVVRAFLLKLQLTMRFLRKWKKDLIFKQLFLFCLKNNKSKFSLRNIQNEIKV
jgi:GT2 family glycosyltransferase